MNSEDPIGIFDSGIGGLTVAHAINKILPNEKIVYFGDTQHLPYGNKSKKTINYYSTKIVDFLFKKKCKAIIIACNTASSIALKGLEKKTKNRCVLFNVIDPVVKYVSTNLTIKNVGIIGTPVTISSNIYKKKISVERKDITIYSLSTPLLAGLIEENNNKLYEGVIESYLSNERFANIDSLILGCTHYPLIESQINQFYKNSVHIISSIKYIGDTIKRKLEAENLLNLKKEHFNHQFYISDYTKYFQEKTKLFFPTSIILEEENIFS